MQMLLNAKCHAIRDAQILEKKIINGEMQDEEKRLDQMMEIERANAIKMQEEIERKRREERWGRFYTHCGCNSVTLSSPLCDRIFLQVGGRHTDHGADSGE